LIFSIAISPLKVLSVSNSGSQPIQALWHFAEGLFYLKKGFLKDL